MDYHANSVVLYHTVWTYTADKQQKLAALHRHMNHSPNQTKCTNFSVIFPVKVMQILTR